MSEKAHFVVDGRGQASHEADSDDIQAQPYSLEQGVAVHFEGQGVTFGPPTSPRLQDA